MFWVANEEGFRCAMKNPEENLQCFLWICCVLTAACASLEMSFFICSFWRWQCLVCGHWEWKYCSAPGGSLSVFIYIFSPQAWFVSVWKVFWCFTAGWVDEYALYADCVELWDFVSSYESRREIMRTRLKCRSVFFIREILLGVCLWTQLESPLNSLM